MKFLNCPHCNTDGVLAMSDGRCPNCKGILIASDEDISAQEQLSGLLNCPLCGTKKVLVMSDGLCPNCKGMLIESSKTENTNFEESNDKRSPEISSLGDEQSNVIATSKAFEELKKVDSTNNFGIQKPVTVPDEGKNCPYCNTEGVWVMSDGRCPNCKQPLSPPKTEQDSTKHLVVVGNAGLTNETIQSNRWFFFSITAFVAFVQSHAMYWGGLKIGIWSDGFDTNTFNWFFNICMSLIAYCIVIFGIKHSQKVAKKNVGTYQAYSLLNGVAFSTIVASFLPCLTVTIPLVIEFHDILSSSRFMLKLLKGPFLIVLLAVAILYMPALRRKRTNSYRIYLCILSILSFYLFVISVRAYILTGFYPGLLAFLAKTPEAILHANGFQFLPIQDYVPAMFDSIIMLFILPATVIYSIFWKEPS